MTTAATCAARETSRQPLYYRARYYNPQTGRFLSEDPIGLAAGTNEYAYVGDAPLNSVDPAGMDPIAAAIDGTTGFVFGGLGALENGGDVGDVLAGALLGGGLGIGMGILAPDAGVFSQGITASGADLLGQEISNVTHGRSLCDINIPEVVGAGVGGFGGGLIGNGFKALAISADLWTTSAQVGTSILSNNLGLVTTGIGNHLGNGTVGGRSCGCN